jgi:hypothetical protein
MDLNKLREYMDFYVKNGLGPQNPSNGMGFNPTIFNTNRMAANWAMDQMGPESNGQGGTMPDYFSGQQVPPMAASAGPNPYTERALAYGARQPNAIARLLK